MTKLSFLLIISMIFVFSCTKEDISTNHSLTGEWQWVSSSGGITGKTITPTTAGFERKLVFTSKSKYSQYKNDELEKSGTFEIVRAKSIYKVELVDFIKFDDGTMSVIQEISSNDLSLADNKFDGYGETYKRIKK
jgi:hypothetical protein